MGECGHIGEGMNVLWSTTTSAMTKSFFEPSVGASSNSESEGTDRRCNTVSND